MSQDKIYWNNYYKNLYSKDSAPTIPSQFAAFVAQEVNLGVTIVDLGCGNGRDSIFFASMGFKVLGIDSSASAIDVCRTRVGPLAERADFVCCSISDDSFQRVLTQKVTGPLIIYSRFFIHAITLEDEEKLLDTLSSINCLDIIALEFRTDHDKDQPKVTPQHFRRFVSSYDFSRRALKKGFVINYFAEGFGFAKYQNDDAHVARFILKI